MITERIRAVPLRYRLALAGIALLLVGTAPLWAPLLLRRLDFFRVRNVEIVGTRYLAVGDILDRLGIDTTASVWDPTAPLARRIAAHPQVGAVRIRRKLPGTLVVEIRENLPVALVPTPQGFTVYDARGVALPLDLARTPVDAPILAQRDTAALRLLAAVHRRMPALYDRVSEVRPAGAGELLLQLPSVAVRAMRDVPIERLAEIAPVEEDLARRQLRAAEIDLRYRDQVIARLQ